MSTTPPQKKRQKIHGIRRPSRVAQTRDKPSGRPDMSGRTLQISADAVAASLAADSDRRPSFA